MGTIVYKPQAQPSAAGGLSADGDLDGPAASRHGSRFRVMPSEMYFWTESSRAAAGGSRTGAALFPVVMVATPAAVMAAIAGAAAAATTGPNPCGAGPVVWFAAAAAAAAAASAGAYRTRERIIRDAAAANQANGKVGMIEPTRQ